MGIFKSATEKLVSKEVEYKLHEKVVKDLTEGKKDLGIWGKAFVDADGDEQRAKGIYIKLMVQHYKDTAKSEAELEAIWNENYQREQAEKEEERLRQEEILRQTQQNKNDNKGDEFVSGFVNFMGYLLFFTTIILGITIILNQ